MSSLKKFILWFIFLSSFGFAGGGYFLIFLVVPFEQWLVNIGFSQREIDNILSYIVYGWVVFGVAVSVIYYYFLLRGKRYIRAYLLALFVLINAIIVFYMFLNIDSAFISNSRGELQEVNERFTFGPYPEKDKIEELKNEGYDGVITLLNPTIVFEKQLLDKEFKNGEEVGIEIISLPMLPWVGDNKEAIDGLKQLINKDDSRYYVHCYLGKHRVDLAKQVIMAELGIDTEQRKTMLPSDFERGNVYSFDNENVIIGPFPTDEEWSILLRRQVKEVISLLPADSSYLEYEQSVVDANGIKLTSFPIEGDSSSYDYLKQIYDYAKKQDHRVYIHGFNSNGAVSELELLFRKQIEPFDNTLIPSSFSNGELYKVGREMVLGPEPNNYELSLLSRSGIDTIISLNNKDNNNENNKDLVSAINGYGLEFEEISIKDNGNIHEQYNLAVELEDRNKNLYIYGETAIMTSLYKILYGRNYGFDDSNVLNQHLKGLALVERDIVVGPGLNQQEWVDIIKANGFKKVIMINSPSINTIDEVNQQKELAEANGIEFEVIEMFEGYQNILIDSLSLNNETIYIIVAEEFHEMVVNALTDY